jgi:hypothetical protein
MRKGNGNSARKKLHEARKIERRIEKERERQEREQDRQPATTPQGG